MSEALTHSGGGGLLVLRRNLLIALLVLLELAGTLAYAQSTPVPGLTVDPEAAVAGTFQTIVYTSRVHGERIVPGGGVRIELPVAYGETEPYFWSKPQTDYPDALGYVTATSSKGDVRVSVGGITGGIIIATLQSGLLSTGDSVTIRYSGVVQSLARDVEVRYAARSSPEDSWKTAPSAPDFRILPRRAHTLVVTTPADVGVGETFDVAVVLIDRFGNLATGYRGSIRLHSSDASSTLPRSYTFEESDGGAHVFSDVRFGSEGFQRITASDPERTLQISWHHAYVWPSAPPLRRFFGDTHFHTGTGTGHHGFIGASSTEDINTLPTRSFQALNSGGDHRGNFTDAATAYRYARDVVRLDFASSSEHDAILFDSVAWSTSQAISEDFNTPGRFTTFFAYEWTSESNHHLVLYPRAGGRVYARDRYPDLLTLWKALDEQGMPALTIPHVTWTFDDHTIWDTVNNTYRRVGEIYSLWNNRYLVQPDDEPQRFELGRHNRWSYQYAWPRGHRIGLIGATDNHLGHPGANNYTIYTQHTGGLAAAVSNENTREGLWKAFNNRHTYATTGTRIYLDFHADGHPMGSEYATSASPMLTARVAGTNKLASVEIVKYERGMYSTVYRDEPDGYVSVFDYEDQTFDDDAFYYLRVKQVDEYSGRPWSHSTAEMAWSSPIWISKIAEDD